MRYWVDGSGRWSGGGQIVLDNLAYAAHQHPDILMTEPTKGAIPLLPRNVPTRLSSLTSPFVWMPQNALPWGPPAPAERGLQCKLRVASEVTRWRAKAMIRISGAIPALSSQPTSPVLHNVLDAGFDDLLSELSVKGSPEYFFASGSAHSYRQFEQLIRGYSQYRRQGGQTSLVVQASPGSTNVEYALRSTSRAEGLDLRMGPIGRRDLVNAMAGARGVLFSSAVEASPVTLLEAQALGIPVVLTDIPGHQELASTPLIGFNLSDPISVATSLLNVDAGPSTVTHPLQDPLEREAARRRWASALTDFLKSLLV